MIHTLESMISHWYSRFMKWWNWRALDRSFQDILWNPFYCSLLFLNNFNIDRVFVSGFFWVYTAIRERRLVIGLNNQSFTQSGVRFNEHLVRGMGKFNIFLEKKNKSVTKTKPLWYGPKKEKKEERQCGRFQENRYLDVE